MAHHPRPQECGRRSLGEIPFSWIQLRLMVLPANQAPDVQPGPPRRNDGTSRRHISVQLYSVLVSRASEGEDPVHLMQTAMPDLPQQRNGFQPAEAFFDGLPFPLAECGSPHTASCVHQWLCHQDGCHSLVDVSAGIWNVSPSSVAQIFIKISGPGAAVDPGDWDTHGSWRNANERAVRCDRENPGLALIGIAVGMITSFALARLIASLLFRTAPTDPLTFVGMMVLLGSVALLAGYLPARRASKIDPKVALRTD